MEGRDLPTDSPASWSRHGSALLLNPRLDPHWRARIASAEFPDLADHIWIASSGTSGRLKIVALSRQALESAAAAANRHLGADRADTWLNALPLFHVGGLGIVVRAALSGSRCEFLADWSARDCVRCAKDCGATLASLVPAQVHDIARARLRCPPSVRGVVVGGGALDEALRVRAAELGWPLLPSYGMTETCSQIATAKPGARDLPWLPLLDHVEVRTDADDVLEVRGPSLLTGWMLFGSDGCVSWEDPKVDGWFRTSDRVELRADSLRVLGRIDDSVKIRGELVDVAALESELQAMVPSGLVRIDVSADERNGAVLIVVAENPRAEGEARAAIGIFPPYARPSALRVGPIETGPLGKKIRPTR